MIETKLYLDVGDGQCEDGDEHELDQFLEKEEEHWQDFTEAIDAEASATSGKFQVTMTLLDSFMKNTREKIIFVSYSTKVKLSKYPSTFRQHPFRDFNF